MLLYRRVFLCFGGLESFTLKKLPNCVLFYSNLICLFVVVWGPESGCTAACRLIVHTLCAFNVPTFTARMLQVTTTLEILPAKC
jgi:hypothetical protein